MDIKADAYIALTMCISARWGRERSEIVIWVKRKTSETEVPEVLVGANGLEPLTPCTSSRCSSQLS